MNHGPIDILSVTHFMTFFLLGVYWKNKYKAALLIGILWEIIEYLMITNEPTRSFILDNWFVPEKYIHDTPENSTADIIINMIGYHIGNLIIPT